MIWNICWVFFKEEFEDTKGVIRIRKSKNRQHNCQKKKYKKTNNDLQNIHIKLSNINPSSNNKTLNACLLARVITGSHYT